MPFITKDRRIQVDAGNYPSDIQPGDRCYKHYSRMVKKWKAEPRWTTAHEIYKDMLLDRPYLVEDESVACELAWQILMIWYILPYEQAKETENGTI